MLSELRRLASPPCAPTVTTTTPAARGPGPARARRSTRSPWRPWTRSTITTLVDNSYDGLHGRHGPGPAQADGPPPRCPPRSRRRTCPGLVAEHGFSALVTVRRGERTHTLLFDTGVSPDGMAANMERLGLDAGSIEAVVLSHGHFDHAGGFPGWPGCGAGRAARHRPPLGLVAVVGSSSPAGRFRAADAEPQLARGRGVRR